jgi:prepilin-type N-terminal cleavage/methylation domain-containing protein
MSLNKQPRLRKTRLRAFTLVECLVALAILGVATLTMAQVYSAVARMSRDNEFMNISLSEQMKYVEARSEINSEAIQIPSVSGTITPESTDHKINTTRYRVFISGGPVDNATGAVDSAYDDYEYEYGVDTYILLSRDGHDTAAGDAGYDWDGLYDETNSKLRYKYLLPSSPV